jgi:membrane protein implicated in regulation of membrane protease activity
MVAGIFMVGFELVEIMVVGFTPVQTPSQPQAWLQVFYLAIGTLIAVLGWRLWRAEQEETQTSR